MSLHSSKAYDIIIDLVSNHCIIIIIFAAVSAEPEAVAASGRRTKLPCFRPESANFSLWNILKKNIGKDLSRISMPVTLNEPLNALQVGVAFCVVDVVVTLNSRDWS